MRLYRDIDNKLSRIRRWIAEGINTLTSSKWSMNTKHDLPLFNKGTIIFLQQMLKAIKFRPPVDQTFGLLCPCAITACFFLHWCIYSKIPCHTRKELTHGSNLDRGLQFLFGLNWKVWKSVLDKNIKTQHCIWTTVQHTYKNEKFKLNASFEDGYSTDTIMVCLSTVPPITHCGCFWLNK